MGINRTVRSSDCGFTLIELLVALSLSSVIMGMAVLNLLETSNPSLSEASKIATHLKKARAKALASTLAYTLSASSVDTLQATSGTTCSATQTPDPDLTLLLEDAQLSDITWSICFNSRGFPNSNVTIPLSDGYSGNNIVEILLGGSIRVL